MNPFAKSIQKSLPLMAALALGACADRDPPQANEAAPPAAAVESVDPVPAAAPVITREPGLQELTLEERSAPVNAVARCMIDSVAQQPLVEGQELQVSNTNHVQFIGWVGDPQTETFPTDPALRFDLPDGSRAWEVGLGEPYDRRPVAEMYKSPTMEKTGFSTDVDLSALPAGTYSVRTIYNISGDPERRVACNRDFRIRIGD